MAWWLKTSGSGDSPHLAPDWAARLASWRGRYGSVSMFPRRPRIERGDRLVSYAAGSHREFGESRIFLVEEVLSDEPEPGPHDRWPWLVHTRPLIAGPGLDRCPEITEIGIVRRSLGRHSHVRLSDEQGERAAALIARAAADHGALVLRS